MPEFTRGFKLHHNDQILHGAQFPDGYVLVVDDPTAGLATGAVSLEHLLQSYHGARIEWAPPTDRAAILREAIGALEQDLERFFREYPEERQNSPWVLGWKAATTELRRLAAEAQHDIHVYLSTGCRHNDHAYCKSMTGLNGAKRPGECKHCGAKCICPCHTGQPAEA